MPILRQWSRVWLAALLACCLIPRACVSDDFIPPQLLAIAYIGPISTPNGNSVSFGQPGLYSFLLAVETINAQTAAYAADPTLPRPLLGANTLIPIYFDSESDQAKAIDQAYEAYALGGAIAIIGEWQTDASKLIQYICSFGTVNMPQISPGASGVDFTTEHDTTYPYFMRNIPSCALQAAQLTRFLFKTFSWKKIGILHATDSFGSDGSAQTVLAATDIGTEILADVSFGIGDTDFTFQISYLVSSNARIIVFWGLTADLQTLWTAIKAGYEAGTNPNLLGSGYQWILCEAATSDALYKDLYGDVNKEYLSMVQGAIGISYYVNKTRPAYLEYEALAASAPLLSLTPTVANGTAGSPFAFDAVYQVALGMDVFFLQGRNPINDTDRSGYYNSIRNRTFAGASGDIALDSVGDAHSSFGIFNFQRSAQAWVNIGVLDSYGNYTAFDGVGAIEYQGETDYYTMPPDTPARGLQVISTSTTVAMSAVSGILIFFFALVQGVVYYYRGHNLIKGSSPLFLVLFLVGIQMLCASVIPRALESETSQSPHQCNADLWLSNLGYTLLVGALLVKTYRLQAIFNITKLRMKKQLGDSKLLAALVVMILLEACMLIGLQYGLPMSLEKEEFNDSDDYYSCRAGSDSNQVQTVYIPVTISTRFALLVLTAVMAFRVRNLPDVYNESKQLLVTVYNLLFISVLLPVIDVALGRGKETGFAAYAACVFFICIASVLILFGPKFYSLFHGTSHLPEATPGSCRVCGSKDSVVMSGHQSAPRHGTGFNGTGNNTMHKQSIGGGVGGAPNRSISSETKSATAGGGGTNAHTTNRNSVASNVRPISASSAAPVQRLPAVTTRPLARAEHSPAVTHGASSGTTSGTTSVTLESIQLSPTSTAGEGLLIPANPQSSPTSVELSTWPATAPAAGSSSTPAATPGKRPLAFHMSDEVAQQFARFMKTKSPSPSPSPSPNETTTTSMPMLRVHDARGVPAPAASPNSA